MKKRAVFAVLACSGMAAAPAAQACADILSPSGKISCIAPEDSVKCIAPWAPGVSPDPVQDNVASYRLGQNAVQWGPGGFGGGGQITLSYGVPVTVNGWQIVAQTDGLTFKKNGKGVFVSVQDVHAL